MQILPRLAAAACALALAVASCGPSDDKEGPGASPPASAPLRIGLEAAYPPFEATDDRGEVEGFDVDLARALAESLGRPAVFRNMKFDALIPELQAGRIDVICSGMSFLPERELVVDFSRPYVQVTMGVLVSTEKGAAVKTIADLESAGTVIAVQRGTSGEIKGKERFPAAEFRPFATEVDAASEVAAGRAHAFVYDMVSVRKLAEKFPGRVRIVEGDLGGEVYCMAFAKGSPLVAAADAFLVRASEPGGVIDRLMSKWKPDAKRWEPAGK